MLVDVTDVRCTRNADTGDMLVDCRRNASGLVNASDDVLVDVTDVGCIYM